MKPHPPFLTSRVPSGHAVDPAARFPGRAVDLAQHLPEAEVTVTDRELRADREPAVAASFGGVLWASESDQQRPTTGNAAAEVELYAATATAILSSPTAASCASAPRPGSLLAEQSETDHDA